jgi:hypothetical protein
MKGKISRTPIIFTSVTGKVYENGSMPKIAKVVKEEPKIIVKEKVVTVKEHQKNALQLIMEEKFPNLHRDTIKGIFETYPNFPTEIKDQIIMQGYAVEDVFTVIDNYNNIDKPPRVDFPIDENFVVTPPIIAPAPNQDNTNKNTKSSDKKLLFLGVGLGLGILLLTLNN